MTIVAKFTRLMPLYSELRYIKSLDAMTLQTLDAMTLQQGSS